MNHRNQYRITLSTDFPEGGGGVSFERKVGQRRAWDVLLAETWSGAMPGAVLDSLMAVVEDYLIVESVFAGCGQGELDVLTRDYENRI